MTKMAIYRRILEETEKAANTPKKTDAEKAAENAQLRLRELDTAVENIIDYILDVYSDHVNDIMYIKGSANIYEFPLMFVACKRCVYLFMGTEQTMAKYNTEEHAYIIAHILRIISAMGFETKLKKKHVKIIKERRNLYYDIMFDETYKAPETDTLKIYF